VLYETLRLNPSGWMTSRGCVEDITIDGWFFPKGSVVYIDIRGIHRCGHSSTCWVRHTARKLHAWLCGSSHSHTDDTSTIRQAEGCS
jgi:hypothetical protein